MNEEYKKEYASFLRKFLNLERPLKVVFDATNGPAGMVVREIFANPDIETSVEMIIINDDIDPDFKAHAPNPLLPGASDGCRKAIIEKGADIGIMSDADGDRAFFLDEKGEMIPACFITKLLGDKLSPPFIADELVYESLRFLNIYEEKDLIPSRIGGYFIKKAMRETGASFGSEYSGHYYFKEFFGLDSGLLSTVFVLNAVSKIRMPLSKWQESFGPHDIQTIEIGVAGKDVQSIYRNLEEKYGKEARKIEHRDGITFVFEDFWVNIRTSNTEPIMRIVAGGGGELNQKVKEIENFVRES
ncbi:MAG: hypothetical protein V4438_00225 [Patescibacteria group bacterium]